MIKVKNKTLHYIFISMVIIFTTFSNSLHADGSDQKKDFKLICSGTVKHEYTALTREQKAFHATVGTPAYELKSIDEVTFYLNIESSILVSTDFSPFRYAVGKEVADVQDEYLLISGRHPNDGSPTYFSISRMTGKFGPSNQNGGFWTELSTYFSGSKLSWTYDILCKKNDVSF